MSNGNSKHAQCNLVREVHARQVRDGERTGELIAETRETRHELAKTLTVLQTELARLAHHVKELDEHVVDLTEAVMSIE